MQILYEIKLNDIFTKVYINRLLLGKSQFPFFVTRMLVKFIIPIEHQNIVHFWNNLFYIYNINYPCFIILTK